LALPESPQSVRPGKTILIADDDETIRILLRTVVAAPSRIILEASNGYDAIQLAVARSPDLLLLDLRMPLMRGESTSRLLRDYPETNRTRIIVISGEPGAGDGIEPSFRADAYFKKPFDLTALRDKVSELLGDSPTGS
jgi:CheY-like chemotaxis protein